MEIHDVANFSKGKDKKNLMNKKELHAFTCISSTRDDIYKVSLRLRYDIVQESKIL